MSLKDAISKAMNSSALTDEDSADVDAALEAQRAAQKRSNDIDARSVRLLEELANTEEAMGRAALAGDDAKAKALAVKAKEIEQQRIINAAARKAALAELDKAKADLHRIGVAGQLKTQRRLTSMVEKNAKEMDGHLDKAAACFVRNFELIDKIKLSLPLEYQDRGGMMLQPKEFLDALTLELWRKVPVHPIANGNSHPMFPGAHFPILGSANPDTMPKFVDAVSEAMAHILRRVEEGPALQCQPEAQPEPVAAATPASIPQQHQKLTV